MRGLVDIDSITWEPIRLDPLPRHGMLNYSAEEARGRESDTSRKILVDQERVCELEDSERWRDLRSERKSLRIANLTQMQKNFEVRDLEYSDLDIAALKLTLVAAREGTIRGR